MNPTNVIPRYCPDRPLPPYSYVTGVSPHPTGDPRGHSFGHAEPPAQPLDSSSWRTNANYLYAIDLFNQGFYWEAHEAWESLWHAAGRTGPTANFLKGLIKLAAAGVKAREGRATGVRQHAERASRLFKDVAATPLARDGLVYGLVLSDLNEAASRIAGQASQLAGESAPDATRSLPLIFNLQ